MKDKIIFCCIGVFSGAIIMTVIISLFKGQWDFQVNIIDMSMLLATILLSVAVVYLTKSLDKKDIVRNLVVKELDELCEIYQTNSDIIKDLNDGKINLDTARQEVKMTFHKGDLVIDCIRKEIEESFPKFKKQNSVNFVELTATYYKWLTDGALMKKRFQVDLDFQKAHETILRNTITTIKLVTHKLVKSV